MLIQVSRQIETQETIDRGVVELHNLPQGTSVSVTQGRTKRSPTGTTRAIYQPAAPPSSCFPLFHALVCHVCYDGHTYKLKSRLLRQETQFSVQLGMELIVNHIVSAYARRRLRGEPCVTFVLCPSLGGVPS